jgi:DNA polymerase III delta prime subunit
MLSRFAQQFATKPDGGAWLFLGAPREEVFVRVQDLVQTQLFLTPEAFVTHPDVQIVRAPEEKTVTGRQRAISVEDIRDVLERLSLTSLTGKKYLFLPDADLLSDSAQNALLKIVEDPAGKLVACFFTEDLSRIVAPLRSRLSLCALPPLVVPTWDGSANDAPAVFCTGDVTTRLRIVEHLVKEGKGDVEKVLHWLVVLQAFTAQQGEGSLFLLAISAWDGIRAQGNVHAHLTRVALGS